MLRRLRKRGGHQHARAALRRRVLRRADGAAPREGPRECKYCTRTLSLAQIAVLDNELGVMHNVVLCRLHMPWQHRLQFVNTVGQLACDLSCKYTTLNSFRCR